MGKWVKYQILIILLAGFTFGVYARSLQDPPPPMMQGTGETEEPQDCGETIDPGTGAPPPPKGLCLPINDYLFPLFISGVALGAFQLLRITKRQEEIKNSAL